jgi:hypothetical protein
VNFKLDNQLGKVNALKLGVKFPKYNPWVFFDADCFNHKEFIRFLYDFFKKNLKISLIISSKKLNSFDLQRGSFVHTVDIFCRFFRSAEYNLLFLIFNKLYNTKFIDILNGLRGIKRKPILDISTKEK